MPKPMKARIGIDLGIAARGRDEEAAKAARAELRRRIDNLDGALIPEWEKAQRGPNFRNWELPS